LASNLVAGDTNGAGDVFVHDRQTQTTSRVSVDSAGNQSRGSDYSSPAISADGRYVAFSSLAPDLVSGDGEHTYDVFVHDRQAATTSLASVDGAGNPGDGDSSAAAISADGRYVAFSSAASNLVPGDNNGAIDVFIRDHQTGTTSRVSVDSLGRESNGNSDTPDISADGRYVSFHSYASTFVEGDSDATVDVFVHDRHSGSTGRVSVDSTGRESNGDSGWAAISANGGSVAFESGADNLVPSDSNYRHDVFVHDWAVTPLAAPTVTLTDPVNAANVSTVAIWGTGDPGTTANISVDDEDPANAAVTTTAPVSESGNSATLDLSSLADGTLTATVTPPTRPATPARQAPPRPPRTRWVRRRRPSTCRSRHPSEPDGGRGFGDGRGGHHGEHLRGRRGSADRGSDRDRPGVRLRLLGDARSLQPLQRHAHRHGHPDRRGRQHRPGRQRHGHEGRPPRRSEPRTGPTVTRGQSGFGMGRSWSTGSQRTVPGGREVGRWQPS